ncbi:hypothetical protein [Streptomyces scopuliridis]|uniref:hypothetical protein n=1 Tax=Streptomyces scopuliridis TaxID=452529 RepID=UPI0036CE6B3E
MDVLPAPVRHRLLELARGAACRRMCTTERSPPRARELRAALPGWAAVYYAVKANSFPGVVRALAPYVDGFEVASVSELELALTAREFTDTPAVAAGPAKSVPVLTALVRARVEAINAESLLELHRISRIAVAEGVTARVALRVTPGPHPDQWMAPNGWLPLAVRYRGARRTGRARRRAQAPRPRHRRLPPRARSPSTWPGSVNPPPS